MLYHTRTAGDEVAIVQHLKEYLRRDVIGIIARQHKLLAVEHLSQVHSQKVSTHDILTQLRKVFVEIGHRFAVNLHHLQWTRFLHQILRHDTHARAYLQNGQVSIWLIHGIGNALSYRQVSQEVLTQIFLWTYLFHACKVTNK